MAMPAIPVQRLRDPVVRVLASRIVNGELAAGAPAPSEQDICNEFGVSKTVSREITATLAAKGLIRVSHGRRPNVLSSESWNLFDPLILDVMNAPDAVDDLVAEMHQIRMLLEPEIASWAARTASAEQLAALDAAMEKERELSGTTERFEADVEFHMVLAHATGNRILIQIMESLRDLMRVSVRRRVDYIRENVKHGGPPPADHHRVIYDALAARDPDAAREAMQAHMLVATRSFDGSRSGGLTTASPLLMRRKVQLTS
jgi:DNA-binding FadR family transcriptional regulator